MCAGEYSTVTGVISSENLDVKPYIVVSSYSGTTTVWPEWRWDKGAFIFYGSEASRTYGSAFDPGTHIHGHEPIQFWVLRRRNKYHPDIFRGCDSTKENIRDHLLR